MLAHCSLGSQVSGAVCMSCAKCRQAASADPDTWCTGCSAWEALSGELTAPWHSPALRHFASELVIGCVKSVRALRGDLEQPTQRWHPPCGCGSKPIWQSSSHCQAPWHQAIAASSAACAGERAA